MGLDSSIAHHAAKVRQLIKKTKQPPGGLLNTMWSWVNSIQNGLSWFSYFPIGAFAKLDAFWLRGVIDYGTFLGHGLQRILNLIAQLVVKLIIPYINRRLAQLRAYLLHRMKGLYQLILLVSELAYLNTVRMVGLERRWRLQQVKRVKADLISQIKALHQTIEREAASGYQLGQSQRLSIIQKVADLIAAHDPAVQLAVKDLITGVLDLASVDSAAARLALTFGLRQLVDRLGLDRVIGDLLSNLLGPLLGQPKPRDLHGVIYDISGRLNGLESTWASFMASGGAQIEQAGSEWQGITGLGADALLLGFFVLAATEPKVWASTVSTTLGPVIDSTLLAAVGLLK